MSSSSYSSIHINIYILYTLYKSFKTSYQIKMLLKKEIDFEIEMNWFELKQKRAKPIQFTQSIL